MANFQIGNSTKKSNKTQSFINRQPKDRSGSSDLELAVYSEPDSIIVGGNPGLYSDYDISGASGNDEIIVGGNVDHNAGSYDASGGTDVVIHGTGGNDEITGYGASEEKRVDGLGAGRAPLFNKGSKRGVSLGKKGALRPNSARRLWSGSPKRMSWPLRTAFSPNSVHRIQRNSHLLT
jgi:hypothetical protein